ncbi:MULTISPECIES: hypothetical protein [unclassified Clostridium]|uniref:hypothetical protein n=1 Tax=unclassified Clostridium TaxID=2614128 RepID=UPI000E5474D6|nr:MULTISPECIES: hypothetical protein [unclassified Clostridium]RHP45624.1 hypothetical protein DWZ40_11955 [Clostridium sp. AF32-12BH]RHV66279.1 hypothetical protein DXB18_08190 [Clostridium sp. OM02-18AC]
MTDAFPKKSKREQISETGDFALFVLREIVFCEIKRTLRGKASATSLVDGYWKNVLNREENNEKKIMRRM